MNKFYPIHWPQFYTAKNFQGKHLLKEDKIKNIIIDSLKFFVDEHRIELNAFVLMSNHIHLIWQALPSFTPSDIQASFMKYTAQQIKKSLKIDESWILEQLKVNKHDRAYQIWKRGALSIELFTPAAFLQKLEYIHNNPVVAGLCSYPEEYFYSSAKFYEYGVDDFGMLTHFDGSK